MEIPKPLYILVDIGCLECGSSSDIVGIFSKKEEAEKYEKLCNKYLEFHDDWGHHFFAMCRMPQIDKFNPYYLNKLNDSLAHQIDYLQSQLNKECLKAEGKNK